MGPLEAKQVLLTTESSFQPSPLFYYTVEDTSNKKVKELAHSKETVEENF